MEILIIDDASTDQSWELICKLAENEPRIKTYRHSKNQGTVRSLMDGFELVQGKYLYMASANDFILPGFFAKAISVLEKSPELAFFCGSGIFEFTDGTRLESNLGWGAEERSFTPNHLLHLKRQKICSFNGQSVVLRKSHMPCNSELTVQLRGNFDLFFFFAMGFKYGFYYSPEVYSRISISGTNFSGREKKLSEKVTKVEAFIKNLEFPYYSDIRKQLIKSGFLSFLGLSLPWLIFTRCKWQYFSWKLIQDLFRENLRKFVKKIRR